MVNRKTTMKDVAKEAQVSLATVSYVLNDDKRQKISEETRGKVLLSAKKLNYIPNMAAKSLVSKESKLVGILTDESRIKSKSKKYIYLDFVNELQKNLSQIGYDCIISNVKNSKDYLTIATRRELDAVFIVDISESRFKEVAKSYQMVPIILIDSTTSDKLFYQVIPDYKSAIKRAKDMLGEGNLYLLTEKFNNKTIMDIIQDDFDNENIIIEHEYSLSELEGLYDEKIIVIGEFLGLQAERYINKENMVVITFCENDLLLPDTIKKVRLSNKEKADKAVEIMKNVIVNVDVDDEKKRILI